jgi:hypothetical protein
LCVCRTGVDIRIISGEKRNFFLLNSSSFLLFHPTLVLSCSAEYVIWFGIKSSKGCNQNNQNPIRDTINTNQVECNACLISRYPERSPGETLSSKNSLLNLSRSCRLKK